MQLFNVPKLAPPPYCDELKESVQLFRVQA